MAKTKTSPETDTQPELAQDAEERAPVDHGVIPDPVPRKVEIPILPHSLRKTVLNFPMAQEEAHKKYGTWEMRALKNFYVSAKPVRTGDLFKITGNEGAVLAMCGQAEFIDPKLKEEQAAIETLQKLGVAKTRRELKEFQKPPKPEPPAWDKPVAQAGFGPTPKQISDLPRHQRGPH